MWETPGEIPAAGFSVQTRSYALNFEAPGMCSVLYSHTMELFKEVADKVFHSKTATAYQQSSFLKKLEASKAQLNQNYILKGFLTKTDAECFLGPAGPAHGTPSLGCKEVLELVVSYVYNTPEGMEAIGKAFMVKLLPHPLGVIIQVILLIPQF
jgi:hypothetical protein